MHFNKKKAVRFFLLSILIAKYLFTGSLKKIDQSIFRNAKEIYFNEKMHFNKKNGGVKLHLWAFRLNKNS
jgi:hypothetical protein